MLQWVKKKNKHDMIAGKDMNKFNEAINEFIKDRKIVSICEFTANVDTPEKSEKWFFAGITYRE